MAELDFTLSRDLILRLEGMDCISQVNNEAISQLATAISRLSEDKTIQALAKQIDVLAQDTMNEVNATAEQLGANYKGDN